MPGLRRIVNLVLPAIGILVAFGGVLYLESEGATLIAVLTGILLAEAGAWNLANPFLPSARHCLALREEVDNFIDRVRHLNAAATKARGTDDRTLWARYDEVLAGMHASVDRMGELAGMPEGAQPTQPPDQNAQRNPM